MASVNKVIIIGNLGRDPETRYMPDGGAITSASVATSEQWKDKSGEKHEKVEWHRLVMFGKLAEIAGEYLKKGSQAYFEGRLQTRKWQDKQGNDRYTTEIVADRMQMLGSRQQGGKPETGDGIKPLTDEEMDKVAAEAKERAERKHAERGAAGGKFDDFESDIPFDQGDQP